MEGERGPKNPEASRNQVMVDLGVYVNRLSLAKQEALKRFEALKRRTQESIVPLSPGERQTLATKVGDGHIMPLSEEALEELDEEITRLDLDLDVFAKGRDTLGHNQIPRWDFVAILDRLREEDELRFKGDVIRLITLRHRHADGEHLTEEELKELNRLPTSTSVEKERLSRLRKQSEILHGVYKSEAIHPTSTDADRRAYADRRLSMFEVKPRRRNSLEPPVLPPLTGQEIEA